MAFFPTLKQNFIAYHFSKVSSCLDCIFEIYQLWQSGFSRVYSNCCCNCSFEPEIIKIGQSSHKMYSNNILNFQESTTILNARTKKSWTLLNAPRIYHFVSIWCSCWVGDIKLITWSKDAWGASKGNYWGDQAFLWQPDMRLDLCIPLKRPCIKSDLVGSQMSLSYVFIGTWC